MRSLRTLLAIRNARIGAEGVGAALRSRWATVSVAACRVGSAAAATELREAANGGFRAATGSVEVPAQLDGAQAVLGRAVFTDPNRAPVPRRADGSAPTAVIQIGGDIDTDTVADGVLAGLLQDTEIVHALLARTARRATRAAEALLIRRTGAAAEAAVVPIRRRVDARAVARAVARILAPALRLDTSEAGAARVSTGAAVRSVRREVFAHATTVGLPARADTVPELAGLPAATGDAAAAAVVVVGIEIDARAVAAAS